MDFSYLCTGKSSLFCGFVFIMLHPFWNGESSQLLSFQLLVVSCLFLLVKARANKF